LKGSKRRSIIPTQRESPVRDSGEVSQEVVNSFKDSSVKLFHALKKETVSMRTNDSSLERYPVRHWLQKDTNAKVAESYNLCISNKFNGCKTATISNWYGESTKFILTYQYKHLATYLEITDAMY
jgi:hypothetical protein